MVRRRHRKRPHLLGGIMITNLCQTPNGTSPSTYQYGTEKQQESSGKWSYRVPDTYPRDVGTFAFKMGAKGLTIGGWLVCVYSCEDPSLLTSNRNGGYERISGTVIDTTSGGVISDKMGWVGAQVSAGGANEIWIPKAAGWVTLEGCSAFTTEDWEQMLDLCHSGVLTHPWIDGQTLPIGGGVSL